MSLDVCLHDGEGRELYTANITNNLTRMGREAGLYDALWHPERIRMAPLARDIAPLLQRGLVQLVSKPEYFRQFDAPNGWGQLPHFVTFVLAYFEACLRHPDTFVSASS